MKLFFALFLSLLVFAPSSFAGEETPEEAIQAIIGLYQSKNFDKLILERYAEIHKAKSDEDISKLIAMFTKKFSNEKRLKKAVQIYELALQSKPEITPNKNPQITESDKIANFTIGKNTLKLYLLKTGKWGFHL